MLRQKAIARIGFYDNFPIVFWDDSTKFKHFKTYRAEKPRHTLCPPLAVSISYCLMPKDRRPAAYLSRCRAMTSSCQRFERWMNRAEKPQTRTIRFGWRSGCRCASRSSSTELQFGWIMCEPFSQKTCSTAASSSAFIALRSKVRFTFEA